MLNFFPDFSFATILARRIHQLLQQKDERAGIRSSDWLRAEARSGTGTRERGTFRKALWQRVYSAVIPILSEVIAFIDRDSNLDLVRNDDKWLSRMWLSLFQRPELTRLHYDDFLSPVSDVIRERVPALTSGRDRHVFESQLPFAVIVKEQIDDMWKGANSVAGKTTSDLSRNLPKTGRLLVNIQLHLMKQRVSNEFALITYFTFGPKRGRMRDWKYV